MSENNGTFIPTITGKTKRTVASRIDFHCDGVTTIRVSEYQSRSGGSWSVVS